MFTALALVGMLILPLNIFPWVLNGILEAKVSLDRIQSFLDLPDQNMLSYYNREGKNDWEGGGIFFLTIISSMLRVVLPPHPNEGQCAVSLDSHCCVFFIPVFLVRVCGGFLTQFYIALLFFFFLMPEE